MTVDTTLHALKIDIPSQPEVMARVTVLLARDHFGLAELGAVVGSDMALAAAVLKAVNSSLFGLAGQIQSVQQALTYLGTREVAAVTLRLGMAALFPPAPELDALWQRAATRGSLMGGLAQDLGVDAWAAHSAGLFEECGKAVLFRHAPGPYRKMLAAAPDDEALLFDEQRVFGVGHDTLGAAMCETWGLAPAVAHSVRHHVAFRCGLALPPLKPQRYVGALSLLAFHAGDKPEVLDAVLEALSQSLGWQKAQMQASLNRLQPQG